LASKFFIPFGKDSTLGDYKMTHIIEQHNLYLQTTKQRIVRNLNDIDEEIDLEVREMFMKHLDNKGNVLLNRMEHTNNSGVYAPA
jgi:hypothetical protein